MQFNKYCTKDLNRFHMNILHLSHCVLDASWRHPNSKAHFTRIYLPIRGEGQICCAGHNTALTPGNIYIIPANTDLSYSCEDMLEKIFVHIVIPRYDRNDLFHSHKSFIVFPDTQGFTQQLQKICGGGLSDSFRIKACLFSIVAQAMETAKLPTPTNASYSELTKKVLAYIDENLSARLSAEQISTALSTSVSTLQKRFRADVGIPMGSYIRDRLLAGAADILCTTDLPIREISDSLGFCDQFYFSKCFSAHFGASPLAYRKTSVPDRYLYVAP